MGPIRGCRGSCGVASDNMLIYRKGPGHTVDTGARVHGSAFMCLSNSQGSLPHAWGFFVHAQAGAVLALEADKTKV